MYLVHVFEQTYNFQTSYEARSNDSFSIEIEHFRQGNENIRGLTGNVFKIPACSGIPFMPNHNVLTHSCLTPGLHYPTPAGMTFNILSSVHLKELVH